jgi:hypothetical protein
MGSSPGNTLIVRPRQVPNIKMVERETEREKEISQVGWDTGDLPVVITGAFM